MEGAELYFKNLWGSSKPLAKLFRTDSRGYLYDTGTNKVVECDENEFHLLKHIMSEGIGQAISSVKKDLGVGAALTTVQSLISAIESENILISSRAKQFGLSSHYGNLEEDINTKLNQLILEVTERCNMRCGYCIYGPNVQSKRNHGFDDMSVSCAQAAIRYLKDHSENQSNVCITFYGGEPLLRFHFIKECIKYANDILKNKELYFGITTNGTLLSKHIAEYFFRNNVSITLSIDGPAPIHNSYRKFADGRNSFIETSLGLRNALQSYGTSSKGRILMSMVYAPPHLETRLDEILTLWEVIPSLPRDIRVFITYPEQGSIPEKQISKMDIQEDKELLIWAFENYLDYHLGKRTINPIARSIVEPNLAKLFQRPVFKNAMDKYPLNACCVPGVRKIYVSANGYFRVCERIDDSAPLIGNILKGIDSNTIYEIYVADYEKKSMPYCSMCWALRLCEVCYASVFKLGKFDEAKKNAICINVKRSKESYLRLMSKLLEINKDGLDHLLEWKIA